MPIRVTCPSCAARIKSPDSFAGRKAKCPKCGNSVKIPAASGPVAKIEDAKIETPFKQDDQLVPFAGHSPIAVVPPQQIVPIENEVRCAFCDELVRPNAKRCKHCGETLDIALRAAEEADRRRRRERDDDDDRDGRRGDNRVVVNVNTGERERPGSLGLKSLILGILACILAVVPCIGIFSLALSIVGLILGLIGLVLSLSGRDSFILYCLRRSRNRSTDFLGQPRWRASRICFLK